MAQVSAREVILRILLRVDRDGVFSHIAVREALGSAKGLDDRERAFVKMAAEGTIERRIELDHLIDQYASVPVRRMKPAIANILRMAVYQMLYMDSVPVRAACDEAVRLTQKIGFYNLKGFVNGILRAISQHTEDLAYPPKSSGSEYLSVRYSMPRWIVKLLLDEYGEIVTEKILAAYLEPRPLTVRMSMKTETRTKAIDSLVRQGVGVRRAPFLGYAYELTGTRDIRELAAFRNGWIYPQDISSMLVAEAAAPAAGNDILELCAAPGGKSLHIADMMGGFGMVEARDLTEEKVELIRENIRRCDVINMKAVTADATVYDPLAKESADIVIADVPCSGLGVIGRKPDIKYRLLPDDPGRLQKLQRSILENAAAYVRPGGVLIYSTCTLDRAENIDNARWFAEKFPFRFESLDDHLPKELRRLSTAEGYLQIVPGIYPADGFFIARFRKEGR